MEGQNGQEKTTFTAEEMETAKQEALNKYKSDQEKGVQMLIEDKKKAEKILDAVGEVAKDQKSLITIAEQDPDVAQAILKKYYGGQSIEEYKASIGYSEAPEVMNEKLIDQRAKSIVNENRIKDTKKAFIEKTGLEGEELQAFEQEFEERTQLKSFNVDKLDEHLTKSFKLATGYSEEKIKEIQRSRVIASAGALNGGDKVKDASKARIKSEIDELLDGRI